MTTTSPVQLPDLFRGDTCVPPGPKAADRGKTFADHFLTEGLMAKFADGGDPRWEQLPLPYLVAAHVGYLKCMEGEKPSVEERISFRSPMLSFSETLEEAWYFTDRTEKKKFVVVPFAEATHFAWKLSGIKAQQVSAGLFRFTYTYSTKNVEVFRLQLEAELQQGNLDNFHRAVATGIVHENVRQDKDEHIADLIDVHAYLKANEADVKDKELLARALERAGRSREWLLYPRDPMKDGRGFSSRFGPNDHLSAPVFARVARAPAAAQLGVKSE